MRELFTGYNERIKPITALLKKYGIASLTEAKQLADSVLDVDSFVHNVQPI